MKRQGLYLSAVTLLAAAVMFSGCSPDSKETKNAENAKKSEIIVSESNSKDKKDPKGQKPSNNSKKTNTEKKPSETKDKKESKHSSEKTQNTSSINRRAEGTEKGTSGAASVKAEAFAPEKPSVPVKESPAPSVPENDVPKEPSAPKKNVPKAPPTPKNDASEAPSVDTKKRDPEPKKPDPPKKKEVVYSTKDITETESIPYSSSKQNDANTPVGETYVIQEGKEGSRTITTRIYYADGVETGREVISNVVTVKPVNEIIGVGTKEAPAKYYYAQQIDADRYFFSSEDEAVAWAENIMNTRIRKGELVADNLMNIHGYSGYDGGTYIFDGVEGTVIHWFH